MRTHWKVHSSLKFMMLGGVSCTCWKCRLDFYSQGGTLQNPNGSPKSNSFSFTFLLLSFGAIYWESFLTFSINFSKTNQLENILQSIFQSKFKKLQGKKAILAINKPRPGLTKRLNGKNWMHYLNSEFLMVIYKRGRPLTWTITGK